MAPGASDGKIGRAGSTRLLPTDCHDDLALEGENSAAELGRGRTTAWSRCSDRSSRGHRSINIEFLMDEAAASR